MRGTSTYAPTLRNPPTYARTYLRCAVHLILDCSPLRRMQRAPTRQCALDQRRDVLVRSHELLLERLQGRQQGRE